MILPVWRKETAEAKEGQLYNPLRVLILTVGPKHDKPWWWGQIKRDSKFCRLEYKRISVGNKTPSQITSLDMPYLLLRITLIWLSAMFRYDYVLTFECDYSSFGISFLQSITFTRVPKHVILQFIMREKQDHIRSRVKYIFMRFCFKSVYMAVCSSRSEAQNYKNVFGWDGSKVKFVLMHTDPRFLEYNGGGERDFILAAGRSFRDYKTLMASVGALDVPTVIVASPKNIDSTLTPRNVTIKYEVPFDELAELMRESRLVVLPLEDRKISIGQSILLQAMAMGKAVVVTETAGTEDYVRNMFDGIFVEPGSKEQMAGSIKKLLRDDELRNRLGRNARRTVERKHLPQHYFDSVAGLIAGGVTRSVSCERV